MRRRPSRQNQAIGIGRIPPIPALMSSPTGFTKQLYNKKGEENQVHLEQRLGIFGGKLKLYVNNEDVLIITHKKMLNTSITKYLLDNIDPRFESYKQFSLGAAITSIACLSASVFLWWYGKTYHQPPDDGAYLFFSFITFIASIIAGVKAYKSWVNIVCFNSHDGRRLFSILGNKPDSNKVEEFCRNLGKRIERIRYNGEISRDRMSEILKRYVEFLYENRVLNEIEVKSAIARISNKRNISVIEFEKKNV